MLGHCIKKDCRELHRLNWMVKIDFLHFFDGIEAVIIESGVFLVEGGWSD